MSTPQVFLVLASMFGAGAASNGFLGIALERLSEEVSAAAAADRDNRLSLV